MNPDHPLRSELEYSLLEAKLYATFNVHKAEGQAQITAQKKLGHLCENRSVLGWWQRIWPNVPYSRMSWFKLLNQDTELLLSLQNTLKSNRSELHVCLDIRKWREKVSLVCSWGLVLFWFFSNVHLLWVGFAMWQTHLVLSCVSPASICWELGRFLMVYFLPCKPSGKGSSLTEYKVSPSRVRGLFASPSEGNWFPVSFLLARCCHLHSHWVPPSHANNPMAINRAVHGRQRKERDTLTPLLFCATVLDKWAGEQGWTHASQEGMPGTRQLAAWSQYEFLSLCPKLSPSQRVWFSWPSLYRQ